MKKWGYYILTTIWQVRRLWPVLIALIFVLFPFDWLGNIWPFYGQIFDEVFVTALAHHIGHSTLFFLASFPILLAFPGLRQRPLRYLALMLLLAVGEEALQSLFKLYLPNIGDMRDLLFDLLGSITTYTLMQFWTTLRSTKAKRIKENTNFQK